MAYCRVHAIRAVKSGNQWLNGLTKAPQFVARAVLASDSLASSNVTAVAPMSGGPFYKPMVGAEDWKKWTSWRDIPDSMIKQSSERDPNNPIYSHPTYIQHRKRQIWYQLPDHKKVWQKEGAKDYAIYYISIALASGALLGTFYEHYQEIYKKFYPD